MFSPWLVTVTTTSGITAPDGSVTVPRIVPKVVCPSPGVTRNTKLKAVLNAKTKGLDLMVGLLILRSHSVTFLILISGFRNRFLLPLITCLAASLSSSFSLDRHRWSLLVAFCPPVVIASTEAVTSHCRNRFPAWFFLQVPELLAVDHSLTCSGLTGRAERLAF